MSRESTKMVIPWPFASEANYALGNYVERQTDGTPDKIFRNFLEVAQMQTDRTVHEVPVQNRDTVFGGRTDSNQTGTIMQTVFVDFDCYDLKAQWSNNYRDVDSKYSPNTNTISIKASIEINGVITPLYFNGQRIKIINEGGVVACDTFGGILKPTDVVKILTYFDVDVSGFLPNGYLLTDSGTEFEGSDGLEYGVDKTDTGGVGSTAQQMNTWGFCNALAKPTEGRKPAVLVVGDSIMVAGGNYVDPQGIAGSDGINRGFVTVPLKNDGVPWTKLSSAGESANIFFDGINARTPFINGHDYVVGNYGANDIMSQGLTFTQLRDKTIEIWEYYKAFGIKVVWATLVPMTTSTDDWFTEAGQTLTADEPTRLAYNDWLVNTAPEAYSNLLYSVIDVDAGVSNNGLWKEFSGYLHSGTADSGTTSRVYDATLDGTVPSGTLNSSAYVVFTGGSGFGEVPRLISNYYESLGGLLIFSPALSVAVDATTEYSIKLIPSNDGIHPTNIAVNDRMVPTVDTSIFR